MTGKHGAVAAALATFFIQYRYIIANSYLNLQQYILLPEKKQ